VLDVDGDKRAISSLPGQYQWSVDRLPELLDPLITLGLRSVILFGVVTDESVKTRNAERALAADNPVIRALQVLREKYPTLYRICDVCMCQYTSHGHCGILTKDDDTGVHIKQEESTALLAEIALHYAQAGAQMVAPSDMIDGRVAAIKELLTLKSFGRTVPVMAYSAKFASAFYGPFRAAANSKPLQGDRRCYQLPVGAAGLAKRAILRDITEGADFVMVKPGGSYLDIIHMAKQETDVPICVYQVSGEYAMLITAAQAGIFSLCEGVMESITAFRRAGADIIITYFTPQLLTWHSEQQNK